MTDSIRYWVRGHSAFEIESLSHKKTRVVFGLFDQDKTTLAWYLFSSTIDTKTQREYEKAEVLVWDDPDPFAVDAGVASTVLFNKAIKLDQLVSDAKAPFATVTFDTDMNCSVDKLNTKSNGLVHLGFHMHKNAKPPKTDVAINGRLKFLEVGPIHKKNVDKEFERGPQDPGSQIAVDGPVF